MIDFRLFGGFDCGQTERQMNLISFSAGIYEMELFIGKHVDKDTI